MPTAFTHAAVGLTLGQLLPPGQRTGRLAVFLAAVAVLPDLDVVAFRLDIPYADPLGHRGLSHSLPFAALLGLLSATLFHRSEAFRAARWWPLAGIVFLAASSHGLLDAATDAGLGVGFFLPFEDSRYFFPFRPLETSAVSPTVFLGNPSRAATILANELRWVGLPLLAFTVVLQGLRRLPRALRSRTAGARWQG